MQTNHNPTETPNPHTQWMQLALDLSLQGQYTAKPNPMVGCVLVKHGQCIGQGYHLRAGQGHAEVNAIADAKAKGHDVTGATAYVSLEPCAHYGRTPPCALTLIEHGIAAVVTPLLDPNPLVAGQGIAMLEQAGVQCTVGVLAQAASAINHSFLTAMRKQMPWVRAKVGASVDGRTAMANGQSKWITSPAARSDVQRLRAQCGAVITGIGTVLADNPSLNVRDSAAVAPTPLADVVQPYRVVLDRHAQLTSQHQLWHDPYLIWVTASTPSHLPPAGLHWHYNGLAALLAQLAAQLAIREVLLECGGTLLGAFIAEDLVDELVIYMAPCLLGSTAQPLCNLPLVNLSDKKTFAFTHTSIIGDDIKLCLCKKTTL